MEKITYCKGRNSEQQVPQTMPAGTNLIREILDELAERLGNFHDESARALADCRQTRDVTAKDNTERVQPITYDAKHGLTRKATASEVHQLRSVTQSLAWIARPTRLDLSYRISKIQSTFENACVKDLRECNRIVEHMLFLHPHVAFIVLQIFLGMMQLL